MVRDIKYFYPKTLREALQVLSDVGGMKILAGGTDLVVQLKEGVVKPKAIMDIKGIDHLKKIRITPKEVRIGTLVTHSQIENSPELVEQASVLTKAASSIGSFQIRNRGTLGGNLVNASPAADTVPALMVLEARVKVESLTESRDMPVGEFLVGPGQTVLQDNELITELWFPRPDQIWRGYYQKLGQRNASCIAIASVAVNLLIGRSPRNVVQAKIALGSVAPTAIRARKAEEMLSGQTITSQTIEEVSRLASQECQPIDDVRGSSEHRREMAGALLAQVLTEIDGHDASPS